MDRLNILVTAVGGDLSQSTIKCLRESRYSTDITGCDMNPFAPGQIDCDSFLTAPPVKDSSNYIQFIRNIVEEKKIDFIFPLSDIEISFFNQNPGILPPSSSAVVMINEPHIISTFMDKYATVDYFKTHGIDFPQTFLPSEPGFTFESLPPFPLILKKRTGSGSSGLFKVNDTEELQFYLKRNENMIIQEFIPGSDKGEGNNEYTAGIFSDKKNVYTIVFRRKLAPGGYSQEIELIDDERVNRFVHHLGKTLDFKGSLNVQFRVVNDRCISFEINPRFSSTVYFRHCFGFRDVEWSIMMAQNQPVEYTPLYKKGIGTRKTCEIILSQELISPIHPIRSIEPGKGTPNE